MARCFLHHMKRLLHEPLLHFLLIGAALFAGFQFVRPIPKATSSSKQIQLSLNDLTQLALIFQSQWKREPTAPELEHLMETRVQTEILYREALAMGLDKDDEIVKRRMAQKMQFLAEDAAPQEPTTAELKSWYAKNSEQFALPKRVSFRHLYFSPDRRATRARDDAVKALAQLGGQPVDAKLPDSFADPFMFQEYYRDRGTDYLGKEFGPQFAQAVAKLPTGSWQGPIESGLGWHLVFVDAAIAGRSPDFEEVEPDIKAAWLGEQKILAWQKAYQDMRAKYTVLLPRPAEEPKPEIRNSKRETNPNGGNGAMVKTKR
jgi:parvulin-like peptidyl-prolyl isomerase